MHRAHRTVRAAWTLAVAALAFAGQDACADLQYQITPLTLGGAFSTTTGISARGDVIGYSDTGQLSPSNQQIVHAFVYRAGTLIDLGHLPGLWPHSEAACVNNAGQVAGFSGLGFGPHHAFVWDAASGMRDLGALGGDASQATAINDGGTVIGTWQMANFNTGGFIWLNGEMIDLGTLGGGSTIPVALNDRNQVVGYSLDAAGQQRTFFWDRKSGIRALPLTFVAGIDANGRILGAIGQDGVYLSGDQIQPLGALSPFGTFPVAQNRRGLAVGGALSSDFFLDTVLWDGAGNVTDLGQLPGGTFSFPTGLNTTGDVVGFAGTATFSLDAFVYHAGTMYDLNDLIPAGSGVALSAPSGINDRGDIACTGNLTTSPYTMLAFLLTRK